MNSNQIKCDLCGFMNDYGNHRYDLKKAHLYNLMVCKVCWKGNWDGWHPMYEEKLLSALKNNNLPMPKRLKNGLFPPE